MRSRGRNDDLVGHGLLYFQLRLVCCAVEAYVIEVDLCLSNFVPTRNCASSDLPLSKSMTMIGPRVGLAELGAGHFDPVWGSLKLAITHDSWFRLLP